MTQVKLNHHFKTLKKYVPEFISDSVRKVITAFYTPISFSIKSGHFKSSFKKMSVDKNGNPIPWYTYSCYDFLRFRDFKDAEVLEFGSGQSTLWWAKFAKYVTAFEGKKDWYNFLKPLLAINTTVIMVTLHSRESCIADVKNNLEKMDKTFDVIVIDGLFRFEMVPFAQKYIKDDGIIICDNSDGYGMFEGFLNTEFKRVDFYGYAPGVVLPHCTSIFYKVNCKYFNNQIPIKQLAFN